MSTPDPENDMAILMSILVCLMLMAFTIRLSIQ